MSTQFHTIRLSIIISTSIAMLVLGLSSVHAHAQTESEVEQTPSTTREERQTERTEAMEERQAARAEDRTERRQLLNEQLQTRFLNLFDNALKRTESAINRLTNIADRLESRLNKLSEKGADVSKPMNTLTDARTKIATAEEQFAKARNVGETALMSETPREAFQAARAEFQLGTAGLREAFQLLRQTLAEMKEVARTTENVPGVSPAVTDQPLENTSAPEAE